MRKTVQLLLTLISCFLLSQFTWAQTLVITSPTQGASVEPRPLIVANSNSTGNTSPNASETIYFEVSANPNFSSTQLSPDYQKSGIYLKNYDGSYNFSFRPATQLRAGTVYYTRAVSSKYGASAVVSFTTSTPLVITSPTQGASVEPRPLIVANSNSTGNTSPNASETIYFEVSANPNFSSTQPSPDYQKSGIYLKNYDGSYNFSFRPATQLRAGTVYYTRAVSSKYGASAVVSFTTSTPLVITSPTQGQIVESLRPSIVANSSSTGNTSPNASETIYFEVSENPGFSPTQPSPDYQRSGIYLKNYDGSYNFSYIPAANLTPGTVYYTRAVSSKYGASAVVSFTTPGLGRSYLILVDGKDATNNNQYADKYITPLTAQPLPLANAYDWEFDADGDFITTPAFYSVTTSENVLNLEADFPGFESGEPYYVRIRGRVTGDSPFVGPWSGNTSTNVRVYRFYNALHPTALLSTDDPEEAPTLNVTTGSMKLTAPHVGNASNIVFQVDDDPDFGSPFSLPVIKDANQEYGRPWLNTTHPGVEGNVFKANVYYTTSGKYGSQGEYTHWVVEHLYGYNNVTYYVRTRAINSNQQGYWSPAQTINVSLPPRVNKFALSFGGAIKEVPNGYTNMPVKIYYPGVTDDPNYIETHYDLQISADNFQTIIADPDGNALGYTHRGIFNSGAAVYIDLAPGTTYQARARTYINNTYPNDPSEWTYTTFTTKSATARLGTDEVQGAETNSQYVVAPNPFTQNTKLTIASGSEKVVVRVTDMVGRVVEELNTYGGETIVLGDQWKSGMYVVQIIDSNGEQPLKTFKVLKQ